MGTERCGLRDSTWHGRQQFPGHTKPPSCPTWMCWDWGWEWQLHLFAPGVDWYTRRRKSEGRKHFLRLFPTIGLGLVCDDCNSCCYQTVHAFDTLSYQCWVLLWVLAAWIDAYHSHGKHNCGSCRSQWNSRVVEISPLCFSYRLLSLGDVAKDS